MEQHWTSKTKYVEALSHAIFICIDRAHAHRRGRNEYNYIDCVDRMIVSEVLMLQDGDTALHNAAVRGHIEAVKTLVDCGAAVDIRDQV